MIWVQLMSCQTPLGTSDIHLISLQLSSILWRQGNNHGKMAGGPVTEVAIWTRQIRGYSVCVHC